MSANDMYKDFFENDGKSKSYRETLIQMAEAAQKGEKVQTASANMSFVNFIDKDTVELEHQWVPDDYPAVRVPIAQFIEDLRKDY